MKAIVLMGTVYYSGRTQIKIIHGKKRMGQSSSSKQEASSCSLPVESGAALTSFRNNAYNNTRGALPIRQAHQRLGVQSFYWGLVTEIWLTAWVADVSL